ncbi:MAG: hypothetical protein Q7J10_04485 [Methanosarcinaceae archaeon]|nr:hypothetical protein [Methanosarcinaceae archaeon]
MNAITAFGIGALVFVLIVLLTAYFLKSASFLESTTNKGYTIETQEQVDDEIDDRVDDD